MRDFAADRGRHGRQWGKELSQTVGFQFRRRYGLPPTDPRYLDATEEEMVADVWAHRFADNPKLHHEVEMVDDDFEANLAVMAEMAGEPPEEEDAAAPAAPAAEAAAEPPTGDGPPVWSADVVPEQGDDWISVFPEGPTP